MSHNTIKSKKNNTKSRTKSKPRTLKNKIKRSGSRIVSQSVSNEKKSRIVQTFLEMLNTVKLYHWKTHSYAQHKATDELYSKLNENIDAFVEILLGKDESRIKMVEKRSRLIDSENTTDFKSRIYEYREFLIDISKYFDQKRDTDLLNIRDEILGNINQFLYLMTFNK
jgi:DNA-binding ferritin-like protein